MKFIFINSSLFILSLFFLISCSKSNKNDEYEEIKKEPISTIFPTDEIIVDEPINIDEDINEFEIINSESTIYNTKHELNNATNDYVGSSYVQISYVSNNELNLRYIFEVKTLDCDISLDYTIYKPDKTTVYAENQSQVVKTVYKSYYENEDLITADDNI